jgi:hypothetical protein
MFVLQEFAMLQVKVRGPKTVCRSESQNTQPHAER